MIAFGAFATTALVVTILVISSVLADQRFRQHARLPMHWSLAGRVNWTAPRRWALSFTPALAAVTLGGLSVAVSAVSTGRLTDALIGLGVLASMSISFVAAHAVHLWLIRRALKRFD